MPGRSRRRGGGNFFTKLRSLFSSKSESCPVSNTTLDDILPTTLKDETPTLNAAAGTLTEGKLLGSGDFGKVNKGSLEGEDVAYKTVTKGDYAPEALAMQQLPEHHNLLKYHGLLANKDEDPRLVMEYAEHGDLSGIFETMRSMRKSDDLSEDDQMTVIRHLMKGSFQGLDAMHGEDLVHGDLKGANIMLGGDFQSKLADFGMTRKGGGGDTGMGGTQAPEVWEEGSSKPGDVFALGKTLQGAMEGWRNVVPQLDDSWMDDLEGDEDYVDFLKKTTGEDPERRLDTKGALEHPFLSDFDDVEGAEDILQRVLEVETISL